MDDQVDVSAAEPQVVAGPSGRTRKRNVSSSSSSTTSSSSSSSSSPKRTKRSRRSRRKKNKRARQSNSTLGKLIKEVQELREQVFVNNTHNACHDGLSVCSGVSGELYDQHFEEQTECPNVDDKNSQLDFTFDIETKLKEPSVPKTPENLLKMLLDVQRLGSFAWSEVRYSDTQKLYNHSPGFIDLDTNEEIKMYDTLRHLAHADKSYAAITFCILKQKESLQEAIRNLLLWAKSTQVNYDNLSGKVEELFQKGDLHKISSDLLQLVCGHRAESIEMRRDAITTQIRDPLVKASLNRIPPTSTHLFSPDLFATALEKAGGVRKAFWPPKSESHTRSNQVYLPFNPTSMLVEAHFTTVARGPIEEVTEVEDVQAIQKVLEGTKNVTNNDSIRFRAGQLAHYRSKWTEMGAPEIVLKLIQGYRIPFIKKPPLIYPNLINGPFQTPVSKEMSAIIDKMKSQGILKVVQLSPSFVSPLFLTPKPDGSSRPIFNLKMDIVESLGQLKIPAKRKDFFAYQKSQFSSRSRDDICKRVAENYRTPKLCQLRCPSGPTQSPATINVHELATRPCIEILPTNTKCSKRTGMVDSQLSGINTPTLSSASTLPDNRCIKSWVGSSTEQSGCIGQLVARGTDIAFQSKRNASHITRPRRQRSPTPQQLDPDTMRQQDSRQLLKERRRYEIITPNRINLSNSEFTGPILEMWGWSEAVETWTPEQRLLLKNSWRKSTLKTYEVAWKRWTSWSMSKNIDMHNPTGTQLAQFLSDLHLIHNLSYNTIILHKSVVSTLCNAERSSQLSSHVLVKHILKSIALKNPKCAKPPIWDISQLVTYLSNYTVNENNIFQISRHTAIILLLCSGRRIHDLTLLQVDPDHYIKSDDSVTLWPQFGSKTDCSTRRQSGWKLLTNPNNSNLNPIFWLEKTVQILHERRKASKSFNLFITVRGAPKPASRTVIAGWVKTLFKEAGIIATPGSTRSAVASKSWLENHPLDEILSRGNWQSAKTFQNFYRREVIRSGDSNLNVSELFNPVN
ncbi:hypothetical protein SFRURICE_006926 [Spodoptera frugiperda]|nr:hypothetical protein SFRURICE_018882 [Spodoptera frugiperda]KAF9797051.1 hypothetical protein SFRURICE_006926 [Spodoptera frugiperda]